MQLVVMVVVPLVILVLAYVNEKGFENLVSQMIVEKYLKPLKPYQPLLVSALGILLAYISKIVGVGMVPDLAPYLTAPGDMGTILAGILVAVLSMAFHQKSNVVG
jgi:Na+/proline symporter